MRNIIIVECLSTGVNFIEDIIKRGYNPIVLEMQVPDTEEGNRYKNIIKNSYKRIKYDFDMIYEKDSFEETLEAVRKYDPLLVLPGNEKGVILASKLSHELGLMCTPIENLDAMTFKHEMQKRIAEHGLRSIKGKVISSLEEAIDFYDSEGLKEVVVKPIYSAGSVAVRICLNRDEMIEHVEELFNRQNKYGKNLDELLVQERINGEEYIVNTVSCDGVPRVTLVWKYNKIKTSDGANVYDSCESVNELSIGEAEMIEYAYSVAEALGITYGPVHGEYMIDEKGPVLIEVNCRPCGGAMPAEFLDRISGQHETDSILDSYLKPKRFEELLKRRYNLFAHGALKFFIVPEDIIAKSTPMNTISLKLDSYFTASLSDIDSSKEFSKTEDVDSAGGTIFLVNEDKAALNQDLNFLRDVEKHAFSLVLSENKEKQIENIDFDELRRFIGEIDKYGTGILVSDQEVDDIDILTYTPDKISKVDSTFDYILVNLGESIVANDEFNVKMFLDIFSKVKTGGYIFIPESTYDLMPNKRRGMEAIIKALNYKIVLPPYNIKNMIIASKE